MENLGDAISKLREKKGVYGANGLIAVEPFPPEQDLMTLNKKSGIATRTARKELVGTTVLYGDEDFPVGATVYFLGTVARTADWAKKPYDLDDGPFLLAEKRLVLLVRLP